MIPNLLKYTCILIHLYFSLVLADITDMHRQEEEPIKNDLLTYFILDSWIYLGGSKRRLQEYHLQYSELLKLDRDTSYINAVGNIVQEKATPAEMEDGFQ